MITGMIKNTAGKKNGNALKKRILLLAAILPLTLPVSTYPAAISESASVTDVSSGRQWDTSVSPDLTDEVLEYLNKAAGGMDNTEYMPLAVLGVLDGTYCVLCKENDGSDPELKNVLVYVNADGIQNTYEIWIGKHAEK